MCVLLLRRRCPIFITAFLNKCKMTKGYFGTKQLLQLFHILFTEGLLFVIRKCSFVSFMLPSILFTLSLTVRSCFVSILAVCSSFDYREIFFYFYSLNKFFLDKFKVPFLSLVFRTKQRVCRHAWWRAMCASEEALNLYMRVVSVHFLTS